MNRGGRPRLWAAALALTILAWAGESAAHPAGFTSVNRYLGVECDEQGHVRLAYLLDFAEFPAYAEIEELDADHDGTVTPAEQHAYLDRRLPPLLEEWTVEINGSKGSLRVVGSNLEIPPGERGLSTLRIAADVAVDPPRDVAATGGEIRVTVRDRAFSDRSGWRQMAAQDTAGAAVVSGLAARPGEALAYSSRPPGDPPRIDEASFVFRLRAGARAPARPADLTAPVLVDERLARLSLAIQQARGSWSFSALAITLALALGAAHALSPGHGKAMAAAYLVGRRARPSQAVLFGGAVTVAHSAVVLLVGFLALTVERTLGSDKLLRLLEVVSAAAIVALGLVQLSRRWREATSSAGAHDHSHARIEGAPDGARSLLALGASAGLTPCPSALALLLMSIAIGRAGFGLILVLTFSLGVAATLTATGLLVLMARRLLDRMKGAAPVLRWLPVMSSACVLAIGVLLCASALAH